MGAEPVRGQISAPPPPQRSRLLGTMLSKSGKRRSIGRDKGGREEKEIESEREADRQTDRQRGVACLRDRSSLGVCDQVSAAGVRREGSEGSEGGRRLSDLVSRAADPAVPPTATIPTEVCPLAPRSEQSGGQIHGHGRTQDHLRINWNQHTLHGTARHVLMLLTLG